MASSRYGNNPRRETPPKSPKHRHVMEQHTDSVKREREKREREIMAVVCLSQAGSTMP